MSGKVRQNLFVIVPCLTALLLVSPLITDGLPDYESHLSEEYQPLKTLKFLNARGREFHKWGPADNFLYAPGYGLSLLYWKLTGTFGPASKTFPYGFHQPLQQLTVLILQSRILLLWLVLLSLAVLGLDLVRAGFSRAAAFFALFLCTATNPALISHAVILNGDGPLVAFSSIALGLYVLIMRQGVTAMRAFWFSTFMAWAITAKEAAVPFFALPSGALVFEALRHQRAPELRTRWRCSLVVGIVALVGWYVLLNVIYAPATWLQRARYLLFEAAKKEVWGAPNRSAFDYAREILQSLVNNLGPGGVLVAAWSIAALLWLRPPRAWLLALPLASFLFLGLFPVGYFPDYFTMPASVALVPLIACAIDGIRERVPAWQPWLVSALGVVSCANLLYANIVWLQMRSSEEHLIEAYVRAHLPKEDMFSIFAFFPRIRGKSRLEALGYHLDSRSISELVREHRNLPAKVFVPDELRIWIEDFTRSPQRAAFVKNESGFDVSDWEGFKALGYKPAERLGSPLPFWYPFGWLPLPAGSATRTVIVYQLD